MHLWYAITLRTHEQNVSYSQEAPKNLYSTNDFSAPLGIEVSMS